MRLAMPTRPLCPLKNSQSANPAALATTFTRRAICNSDNPNTFCLPSTPAGRMAESACMAAGVMPTTAPRASASVLGADHGEAAAAVVPAPHVAPSQRGRLGAPQPRVGQDGHQGDVELGPFGGLFRCLNAAAALAGLDGGEADDGEHVGGEGAGLSLGLARRLPHSFREARTPGSRQGYSSFAHSWALVMALVTSRRVATAAPEPARAAR